MFQHLFTGMLITKEQSKIYLKKKTKTIQYEHNLPKIFFLKEINMKHTPNRTFNSISNHTDDKRLMMVCRSEKHTERIKFLTKIF